MFCLMNNVYAKCNSDELISQKLPNYTKAIELLDVKTLKITFSAYTPLSWYGDWSKPKSHLIKLGNSYKFERDADNQESGYSIEYFFIEICDSKVIIKEETIINADNDIGNNIKYFAVKVKQL